MGNEMKKRKTDRKFTRGGARTRLLMGFFVIALVLVVVNLVFVNIYSAEDQIFIQQASDMRVYSQEIAKNASQAVAGSEEAFVRLAESRNQFQQAWLLINDGRAAYVDSGLGVATALPARREDILREAPEIEALWTRLRTNADLVLGNRERITGINATAAAVTDFIPQLQREYDEIVNTLLDNGADLATIAVAQRQAWLAERISLNLGRIVAGNGDGQATAGQFQRDISLFASNHEALLEGDVSMGVGRVRDAAARARLDQVTGLFAPVQEQAAAIVEAAPEVARASQAANLIAADSERLLSQVTDLAGYFTAARGEHLASPFTGYVLLLAVLVLISLYGLEVIRQSRAAEKVAAEMNRKNNDAVLGLLEEISDLASGDLTVQATVSEDFTGAIADSINYAVGQLRELVSAITEVTVEVRESATGSARTIQNLTAASERQTRSITSVSESIREMEKNINSVSDNAMKSLTVAKNSVGIASGGAVVVKNTIRGMDAIRDQIQESAKRIKRLGENSQEIGGFVSLINDIADHTNTLSLNAAIQAAMAGDAGKGFGVVADEVHALAERSTDATKQIESLVKVIQRDINEAVSSMEQTTAEVVKGTRLAQRAGEALDDIEKVSKELAELVDEITQAARNQSKTAAEITHSMETIQQITTETSSGTKTTSEFIFNLARLTQRLHDAVAGFSVGQAASSEAGHQPPVVEKQVRGASVVAYPKAGTRDFALDEAATA